MAPFDDYDLVFFIELVRFIWNFKLAIVRKKAAD
jgi:hypothetical protein